MGLISGILISLGISGAVRVGKETLADRGLMPAAYYHNLATEAVAQGNLDEAIRNNLRARLRNREFVPAQAQRDLLEMRVAQRQKDIREQMVQLTDQAQKLEEQYLSTARHFRKKLMLAGMMGLVAGYFAGMRWRNGVVTAIIGGLLSCAGIIRGYFPRRREMQKELVKIKANCRCKKQELAAENSRRSLLAD